MKVFSAPPIDKPDLLTGGSISGEVTRCWMGSRLDAGSFQWAIGVDDSRLIFQTWVGCGAPRYNTAHQRGEFVEGLWNEDVVELFVMNSSGGYQEFNLSPAGAWWTCAFSSYRTRASEQRAFSPLFVEAHVTQTGWGALLGVALADISVVSPISEARMHVSSILTAGEQPRYLSSSPLSAKAPDFHDEGCFSRVVLSCHSS
jgi:hypothetical protein